MRHASEKKEFQIHIGARFDHPSPFQLLEKTKGNQERKLKTRRQCGFDALLAPSSLRNQLSCAYTVGRIPRAKLNLSPKICIQNQALPLCSKMISPQLRAKRSFSHLFKKLVYKVKDFDHHRGPLDDRSPSYYHSQPLGRGVALSRAHRAVALHLRQVP